jgi:hypothetical protein
MQEMNTEPMEESGGEPQGIDSIISRVKAYKANPKMVTPETWDELIGELEDLKDYMDEGEPEEPTEEKPSGLTVMIGRAAGEQE